MQKTRRERQREATIEEIKTIARAHMAQSGAMGISLRAIAREMELTVTALYRYYASYDELITDLIVDAFSALADAMQTADASLPETDYTARLQAVLMAYRGWANEHPHEFALIYGTPIPNYVAPSERTVPQVQRGFEVMIRIIALGMQDGVFKPTQTQVPAPNQAHIEALIVAYGFPIPVLPFYVGMVIWTRIHGIIMLELFNHLAPSIGDVTPFYQAQISHAMRELLSIGE